MARKTQLLGSALLAAAPFLLPACGGGGGGGGTPGIDTANSTVGVSPTFGAIADGTDLVHITATLVDVNGNPAQNRPVVISATGASNTLAQASATSDVNGQVTADLSTTIAEQKTITVSVGTGSSAVTLDQAPVAEFVWPLPQTYYVRTSGSDANSGDAPNRAWATLSHAAAQVVPGDTVYVGAGTYSESIDLTRSGLLDQEVFFVADGNGVLTGDAGQVTIDAGGADSAFHVDGASFVVVEGFTLIGAMPGANPGGGISVTSGASNVALIGNTIYGNDRGIYLDGSSDVTIESNTVSNQITGDSVGLSMGNTPNVTVLNNLLYNNASYGLHVRTACTNLDVGACTLYLNGDDQFREDGAGSSGVIHDSILANGLADGIQLVPGTGITENNNDVFGNSGVAFTDGAGGTLDGSSTTLDPQFDDPNGNDQLLGGAQGRDDSFLVQVTSPTIDSGDVDARDVKLSFGAGALTGGTTRVDGTLDGEAPDGSALNYGFHDAAPTDPLTGINSGDGRLFYGRGDNVQVFGRAWDNDTGLWQAPTLTDPAVATVKWVRNQVSPINSQEELLAIFSDTGARTELSVRVWNGRFWTEAGGTNPIDSQIPSANADQRGFDIAYERKSGQAMVVYSDGTNNPVFRTFAFGVWSDEAPVFTTPPGTGTVLWVELASAPTTDQIAMVALTDTSNLVACVWDGDQWNQATATLLDTQTAVLRESQGFDVAFEQVSGDVLVAWGFSVFAEQLRYAVLPFGQTTFVKNVLTSAEAVGAIVRLAPEPGSDRMACAISEGVASNQDVVGMIWNGSLFNEIAEFDLNGGAPDARDIAVAWVGNSGIAVCAYKGNDGGGALDWARYKPGGWKREPDEPLPGIGDTDFIQMEPFPTENKVMMLLSDDTGALFGLTYDGTNWVITNAGQPLVGNVSELGMSSQPFSFSFKP